MGSGVHKRTKTRTHPEVARSEPDQTTSVVTSPRTEWYLYQTARWVFILTCFTSLGPRYAGSKGLGSTRFRRTSATVRIPRQARP